ncbi:MAG: hypothetical protein ABIO29_00250 [Sphingomicrobium sp.]
MTSLSISRAWDETKADMAKDGRLFTRVALALIGFPTMISTLVAPAGISSDGTQPLWVDLVTLAFMLAALIGQLALVRLALKPPMTVGEAIAHGAKRMPVYFVSVLVLVLILLIVAVPIVMVLSALGVPLDTGITEVTPGIWLAAMAMVVAMVFMGVRMIMTTPVACAEHVGPLSIIRRSWDLTRGHWLQLLGFLVGIVIAAAVVLTIIGILTGTIVNLALGPIDPMSASALVVGLVQGAFNAAFSALFATMLARIYVQLSAHPSADPA